MITYEIKTKPTLWHVTFWDSVDLTEYIHILASSKEQAWNYITKMLDERKWANLLDHLIQLDSNISKYKLISEEFGEYTQSDRTTYKEREEIVNSEEEYLSKMLYSPKTWVEKKMSEEHKKQEPPLHPIYAYHIGEKSVEEAYYECPRVSLKEKVYVDISNVNAIKVTSYV